LGNQIKNNDIEGLNSTFEGEDKGDADRVLVAKPEGMI
jgi:hypothetical protein